MTTKTDFSPQFQVCVTAGHRVRMRDGVELNVRITRPDAPGRFPAVLQYNPYRRLGVPPADYRAAHPPVVPYLAERGYVIVQFDVRGTGSSSGSSSDMYSDDERQDGYDMVEWCAAQEWCTGAVGMIGKSYEAVAQWQVAMQNPPSLKAIVVRSGGVELANEFSNPGGCIRPWMFEAYAPWMTAFNFAPPDPTLTGDRWATIWQERLDHSEPWGISFIKNLKAGEYWGKRSVAPDYDRVKCAVLLIEGWADWYASAQLRAFQRLKTPRKALIGPWGHFYAEEKDAYPGPRIDARREYLKWFDCYLKGMDNGVAAEPPVTVFVREWTPPALICPEENGTWLNEVTWPPARVEETKFFFGSGGKLSATPEKGSENYRFRPSVGLASGRLGLGTTQPWGMPLDQRPDDVYSVLYDSEPFTVETELLGEAEAVLYASSTADVSYFAVRLCDVAPDGTSSLITIGGLLSSLRRGPQANDPLRPNEVAEIRFPLRHCAYSIAPGHRLRIAISGALFQNAWPTAKPAVNTIYRGAVHPSHVVLPVARSARTLPDPAFMPSPFERRLPEEFPTPTYKLHHDLAEDTVTCELGMMIGDAGKRSDGINHSRYTVSNRNPERTVIESTFALKAAHPTMDIRVDTACQTVSDASSYTHAVQLNIGINGTLHFQKSWTESVSRKGS